MPACTAGRGETPDREAAVWAPEEGERRALTWRELSLEVTQLAEALVELGVTAGDAVGIFLPMSPEAAIASHACAHIGAIQVPIFSGFAGPAMSSRLADADAKVLLTADASYRRGRLVPMKEVAGRGPGGRRRASSTSSSGVAPASSAR